MSVDRETMLALMRQERYAVEASVSADRIPQAAVVGIVVSDRFEVFFDTLGDSRKTANLRRHPRVAMVLGPTDAEAVWTIQLQGVADEPSGADLERLLAQYFERFPDGRDRQRLPGVTYWRVRPTWLRYSNFATEPPHVSECDPTTLLDAD